MKHCAVHGFLLMGLALLLAACGGGGGSSPSPPSVPPQPFPRVATDPVEFPTYMPDDFATEQDRYEGVAEYRPTYMVGGDPTVYTDGHLGAINAAAAYARGATGRGETVVIADTGLYLGHHEFTDGDSSKITGITNIGRLCTVAAAAARMCSDAAHGTSSAGVAAGRRDEETRLNMHGVAFDANIHAVRIYLGTGARLVPLRFDGGFTTFSDQNLATRYERILYDNGADGNPDRTNPRGFVFNFSFGVPHGIASYTRDSVRGTFPRLAALFAQSHRDPADRSIIVWAAGNRQGERYDRDAPGDQLGAPIDATAPSVVPALGVHFPELQGHVLTVVAVGQDGVIASFSNHCGIAKSFCLAAPGVGILAPTIDSAFDTPPEMGGPQDGARYRRFGGTSAAAPVVTGALAVMRSFFRNADGTPALGNTELVTRLLATADRTDRSADGGPDYSDSDTYGHGLVDLDAATRPVGMLMTSVPEDESARPLFGATMELGGALGAELGDALDAGRVVGFDELGAPFPVTLGEQVRRPGHNGRLPRALRMQGAQNWLGMPGRFEFVSGPSGQYVEEALLSFDSSRPFVGAGQSDPGDVEAGWWMSWGRHDGRSLGLYRHRSAGRFVGRSAFAAPWLSLVQDGLGFGGSQSLPSGGHLGFALMHGAAHDEDYERLGGDPGLGVIMDYQPGHAHPSLQTGVVWETDGFLGTRMRGAFGTVSSTTAFAGFNHRWLLNGHWYALASGYFGWTRPAFHGGGLLRDASRLQSSAFSLGLERHSWWQDGDWLGLRISQPLRVESGEAELHLATGRTRYGEVLYRRQRVDLTPAGRALQAEAAWSGPFAGGALFLSLGVERHAGQNTRQDFQFLGAVQFERTF